MEKHNHLQPSYKEKTRSILPNNAIMSDKTSTTGKVSNNFNSDLSYHGSHDWQGKIGESQNELYDTKIAPNTTSQFVHKGGANGSQGYVVYGTASYDILLAWYHQPNQSKKKALALIEQLGAFSPDRWPEIFDKLINAPSNSSNATAPGVGAAVKIEGGNYATLEATISIPASSAGAV